MSAPKEKSVCAVHFDDVTLGERGPVGQRMELAADAHVVIEDRDRPSQADWATFTKRDIVEMDGTDALLFWRRHKAMLLALAGHNEVAA